MAEGKKNEAEIATRALPLESPSNDLSLFQPVSGQNSTNPAIRLVPGAGGIFSSPQRADSVELIVNKLVVIVNLFGLFYTSVDDDYSPQFYSFHL